MHQIAESALLSPARALNALSDKRYALCIAPNSHGTTPAYVYYLTRNKGRTQRCLDNGTLSRSILQVSTDAAERGANTPNHEWNMAHRINFDWPQQSHVFVHSTTDGEKGKLRWNMELSNASDHFAVLTGLCRFGKGLINKYIFVHISFFYVINPVRIVYCKI